jgi:hypothetical protein
MALGKEQALCRVSELWHSAKKEDLPSARILALGKEGRFDLPSAGIPALGKEGRFAECRDSGTRQRRKICRVPEFRHSAKILPLPSALYPELGKDSSGQILPSANTR